ncbi:MAG: phage/plasmid primase, P4 family [Arcobacteraceae bacterium]|nr:phage/plasmid primase, P4 family [Arcobacteraceae bacterium]
MEDNNYNIGGSSAPHLNNDENQDLLSNPQKDEYEAHLVDPEIEAEELAESYNAEEHQTEPDYGNPEDEEYELEDKNDDDPLITDEIQEVIESHKTFDETNTEEGAVKKSLNALLSVIVFFISVRWGQIYDELNEGIIGKKVPAKDCYRIGFIDHLKQFAKTSNILFAKDANHLYVYSGEYWIKISEDLIKGFLHRAAKKMGIPEGLSKCVKFIKSTYEQLIESGFFEKMVQTNITCLNLLNGTLKIDSNGIELVEFNPKHFLTHQLDFKYDKSAINQLWLDFLDKVLPDKDTQKTLQQSLGYLFIRGLKLEKAFFLVGNGSNGKSVIFEVLKGILSSDMMTNHSLVHLTNKLGYHVADLNNKLINYGTDISMKNVDPAVFKQLVSGEPIGTRQIREKTFTMRVYAKLIFNVNKLENADVENTDGFFRRMIFIYFGITIPDELQDKNLHIKLLENKAGIMNWIAEGILEVLKNEEIFQSEQSKNFLENFKKEVSPIQLFLADSGLVPASKEAISFQDVYEMYREFCKKQGEKVVEQRLLIADLVRLGFTRTRRNVGNVLLAEIKK